MKQITQITVKNWPALLLAAILLCWPACWNGFPLFFADTDGYLQGRDLLPALWGGEPWLFWRRSTAYEMSLLPLNVTPAGPWIVILMQSLATAWVIRLFFDKQSRPGNPLAAIVGLAILSPLPWIASLLMPDILSGLLILVLYWMGLGWGLLSKRERLLMTLLSLWAITAHTANYPVAGGLAALAFLLREPTAALRILAVLTLSLTLQLGINYRVYHRWGVQVEQPPFLLARLLSDGTAIRFLERNGEGYALAGHYQGFRREEWHILWHPDGLVNRLRSDNNEIWEQVRKEELSLVLAVCRTYPLDQIRTTLSNMAKQMTSFQARGPYYMGPAALARLQKDLPELAPAFFSSRQGQNQLDNPQSLTCYFQITLALSLILLTWLVRVHPGCRRLLLWATLGYILSTAVSAGLSMPNSRYNLRIVWVFPVVAAIALCDWQQLRKNPRHSAFNEMTG